MPLLAVLSVGISGPLVWLVQKIKPLPSSLPPDEAANGVGRREFFRGLAAAIPVSAVALSPIGTATAYGTLALNVCRFGMIIGIPP